MFLSFKYLFSIKLFIAMLKNDEKYIIIKKYVDTRVAKSCISCLHEDT